MLASLTFRTAVICGLALMCVPLPPIDRNVAAEEETSVRGWKWGTGGKQTFEGRLVSVEMGFVKIKGAKGKEMLIPLDRLFPEDREYVDSWVKSPVAPATSKKQQPTKPTNDASEAPEIPTSDRDRVELARNTREWQKTPLDSKGMMKCLAQLRSPDPEQRKHAMTQLAVTRPNDKFSSEVVRLSKECQQVVGADFYRKVYPQVCDSWEGYEQAVRIHRRAKNILGLEALIVNGNSLERSQAIAALKFQMTADAAEVLVSRFATSPLDCKASLIEMGPVAAPKVATLLNSNDAKLRREGLDILEEIGGEEQYAMVRGLLTDSDPQVRIAATQTVKAMESRMKK